MDPEPPVLVDEAITTATQDRLRRSALADRVRELLVAATTKDRSTVTAIVGPWGSGKTSLIGLIREGLPDEAPRIVNFNPWLAGDVEQLVADFFRSLIGSMPRARRSRRVKKAMKRYGAVASAAASLLPWGGQVIQAVASPLLAHPSLHDLRLELTDELARARVGYLVIVDDIDRLQAEELLALLRLLRLVGRLPYVHYLLAFDEETILGVLRETAIASDSSERAQAFLEKIVQTRIDLPDPHPRDLDRFVTAALDEALSLSGGAIDGEARARFDVLYDRRLRPLLRQPRQIVRVFTQVGSTLPLVSGEVDVVDLVGITFVRTCYPALYRELQHLGEELTRSLRYEIERRARRKDDAESVARWQKLIADSEIPERDQRNVLELLGHLFPTVAEAIGSSADSEQTLRFGRRIGSGNYFGRYFQMGVPPDDLSDASVLKAVVSIVASQDADASQWLRRQLRDNAELVISKLQQIVATKVLPDTRPLVEFLLADYDAVPERHGDLLSDRFMLEMWIADLIAEWSPEEVSEHLPLLLSHGSNLHRISRGLAQISESIHERRQAGFIAASRCCVDAAHARLLIAVRESLVDDADVWLLHYVSRLADSGEVAGWIDQVLDVTEWRSVDFVACFVSLVYSSASDAPYLGDLEIQALSRLVTLGELVDRLDAELNLVDPSSAPFESRVERPSLEQRRQQALYRFRRLRDERFSELPSADIASVDNLRPGRWATWDGAERELTIRVVVVSTSAEDGPPVDHPPPETVLEVFAASGLRDSLHASLASWPAGGPCEWTLLGTASPTFAEAVCIAGEGGAASGHAVIAHDHGGLGGVGERRVAAIDIGLDITTLDAGRQPIPGATTNRSAVAVGALSIAELARWMEASVRSVEVLATSAGLDTDAVLAIWVDVHGVNLEHVVRLDGLRRLPGGGDRHGWGRLSLFPLSSQWESDPVEAVVRTMIAHMLQTSNYRDFQSLLRY